MLHMEYLAVPCVYSACFTQNCTSHGLANHMGPYFGPSPHYNLLLSFPATTTEKSSCITHTHTKNTLKQSFGEKKKVRRVKKTQKKTKTLATCMLSERVKPLKCCAKSFFLRCKSATPNFLKNAVCYKVDLCSAGTGHQVTSSNPHKPNYSGADTGMSPDHHPDTHPAPYHH